MTNEWVLRTALQHSAWDLNCQPEDFRKDTPVIVEGGVGPNARKYYREPIGCNLVSYGYNVVASVKPEYREIVTEYVRKFPFYHCFETPNLHWLQDRLTPLGQRICFMAEYFLPDVTRLKPLNCELELRLMTGEDFANLYTPQWSNALCEARKELDVLGVGAYDAEKLVGLAGASADGKEMWQIGIDVLPEYRCRGLAKALVSHLATAILERDKVPFYCAAWSNIPSVKTAIASGFRPAWVEMTVKPGTFVDRMNQ